MAIKKYFLISLLFAVSFSSLKAQSASDFGVAFTPNQMNLSYGSSFSVNLLLTYNLTVCNNFETELWIPNRINSTLASVSLSSGQSLSASIDHSRTRVETISGVTYNVLIITYSPSVNQLSSIFTIQDLKLPSTGCSQEDLGLIAKLTNSCSVNVSDATANIHLQAADDFSVTSFMYTDYCSVISPMRTIIRLSKNNVFTRYNTVVTYQKNGAPVKCIGVTHGNYQNNDFFTNEGNLPFTDNGSSVVFNTDALNENNNYTHDFMLYFEVEGVTTAANYNAVVNIQASSLICNGDVESRDFSSLLKLSNCEDEPFDIVPDIKTLRSGSACVGSICPSVTSFMVQLDNSFKGTNKPQFNQPITYELTVAPEINIERFRFNGNTNYPVSGNLDIQYQKYGDAVNWYTYTTSAFDANNIVSLPNQDRISVIKFTFPNGFDDYSSQLVDFYYSLSFPAGYPANTQSSYAYTSKIIYQGNILKQRTSSVLVQTSTGVCSGNILRDYFKLGNGFTQNKTMIKDEVTPFLIEFTNLGVETDFTFEFNPALLYLDNLKFYYGNITQAGSFTPTDFKDLAAFKASSGFSSMSYSYNPIDHKLTFTGLNLQANACTSTQKKFYVLLDVEANPSFVYATYRNNPTSASSTSQGLATSEYIYYNADFVIPSDLSYNPELYVGCVDTTYNTSVNLKSGDQYTFHYLLNNIGNEDLKDIVMMGELPHVGDIKLLENSSRGSEFAIPCSSIDEIKVSVLDKNNHLVSIVPSTNYTIDYSTSSNFCLSDLNHPTDPSGCVVANWVNTCPSSSNVTIRIQTKSPFILQEFQKLDVTIKGTTPVAIIGKYANNSFSSKVVANRTNVIPLTFESNVAKITIANLSTCETCEDCDSICAECVPSFSPLPGQEYLLSAWVKEDYTNKYPDTYLHSGIQITFNNGTVILPLMRPTGPIIDGWQRIEASFTVPANAANIQIELVNDGAVSDVYFDDIRIHPFRSNMKSFVYNPSTQKLTAELDENNYSTQYEYDDEGILIRVKKETERGVMTIKETRNNQSKVQGTH